MPPKKKESRLYDLLEVPREADADTIKKAYKKQALKYHPDRNPGKEAEVQEKFKDIANAFSILSDEKKRAIYDKGGEEALKEAANGGGGGDQGDLFNMFFWWWWWTWSTS